MTKVLIIEDDELLRTAYTTKLTIEGFEVESAADGQAGLEKAVEFNPDIILLDMLMPKLDGFGFLKAYDLKSAHPNTKVISFSNLARPDAIKQARDLGVSNYLTKSSYTPNELVAIIKSTAAEGPASK